MLKKEQQILLNNRAWVYDQIVYDHLISWNYKKRKFKTVPSSSTEEKVLPSENSNNADLIVTSEPSCCSCTNLNNKFVILGAKRLKWLLPHFYNGSKSHIE
jgi:hypothetical protein